MDDGILCFVACMTIEDEIDGGGFFNSCKQAWNYTIVSANEIATGLLSEGGWMGGGPYNIIATC